MRTSLSVSLISGIITETSDATLPRLANSATTSTVLSVIIKRLHMSKRIFHGVSLGFSGNRR